MLIRPRREEVRRERELVDCCHAMVGSVEAKETRNYWVQGSRLLGLLGHGA